MKTTLNISDRVAHELRIQAKRRGRTMSELVESALRDLFRKDDEVGPLPELPAFEIGRARVNVANRDALYARMEES